MNAQRLQLTLHVVTIALAASYLTLGISQTGAAARLWWVYAIVTGILAVINLTLERRDAS